MSAPARLNYCYDTNVDREGNDVFVVVISDEEDTEIAYEEFYSTASRNEWRKTNYPDAREV